MPKKFRQMCPPHPTGTFFSWNFFVPYRPTQIELFSPAPPLELFLSLELFCALPTFSPPSLAFLCVRVLYTNGSSSPPRRTFFKKVPNSKECFYFEKSSNFKKVLVSKKFQPISPPTRKKTWWCPELFLWPSCPVSNKLSKKFQSQKSSTFFKKVPANVPPPPEKRHDGVGWLRSSWSNPIILFSCIIVWQLSKQVSHYKQIL